MNKAGKVLWTQGVSGAEKDMPYFRERRQCNLDKHFKICARFSDISVVSGFKDLLHSPFSVLNIQA